MAEMTYIQAISDALRLEMRRDPRVFLMGEDVGVYGGAFKVSLGFQEEFGPWRVIDTPLSETAIVGGASGAALMGLRPVAEMQFADFISCAWDQLVTVAAKQHFRGRTPVPIVVRLPSGGGFSGGPFHSQNPESSFAHIPGLKVVCPSTPQDAKGLLASAIEDPNPVLYFEHKHLYRRIKGEVPDERYTIPFGDARVHREGDDAVVVTWGAMVHTAGEAADELAKEGFEVEVLDLRTVIPWDREHVLERRPPLLQGARPPRGHAHGRLRRRDRGDDRRGGLRAPRRAGRARRRPGHARSLLSRAREGVPPAGRGRRRSAQGVGRLLGEAQPRRRGGHVSTGTQTEVVMPQMGVSVSEGTITKWLKQPGEAIARDEPLLEISTDKVDTEVPSPGEGVVSQILVPEGETVDVGTVLAIIAPAGASAGEPAPAEPAVAPAEAAPEPAAPVAPMPAPRPSRNPWPPRHLLRRLPRLRRPSRPPSPPRPRSATGRHSSRRSSRASRPSTVSTRLRSPAPAPAGE